MNKKYLKLLDEGWEAGSTNTFADLDLPDAAQLQAKAYLQAMIRARIADLHITQVEAARRIGIPQPKLSNLMSEDAPRGFSSDKLMQFATKLGLDVEIKVSSSHQQQGRLIFASAAPKGPKRKPRTRKAVANVA